MKLAVVGQPVSHSRSPAMQSAALAELGLAPEWSYGAIEVAPADFGELVRSLPGDGYLGVNVTVPHKLAALAISDEASPAARAIGAANTLTFTDNVIAADNTDVVGIVDPLPEPPAGKRALVMGAGGSARAAVWALREHGAEVFIWNRTASKADDLAAEFGVESIATADVVTADFDLLVNATTVGLGQANPRSAEGSNPAATRDPGLKALPIDADSIEVRHQVVDLVYGSEETQLIAAARAADATCVDGLDVLVAQGAASLRKWTGAEPPLETMRRAARGT